MPEEKLSELKRLLGEVADVSAASALLSWDQETYMPPKGATARAQQLGSMSALAHRLFTAPEVGELLASLDARRGELAPGDAKLVDETRYDYNRTTKLPEAFVQRFAIECSKAYQAWAPARKASDFAAFRPHLETLLELLREKAELLGYEESPYDALLEDHERGMTAAQLKTLFGELARRQSVLVEKAAASPHQPDVAWLDQEWDEQRQWDFTLRVLRDMGFDLEAGRQDRSVHPFTTSFDMRDVRLTTRLSRDEPFSALTGSIHEGGHGLYEQGFLETDRRTPLAQSPSLGMHESQSRMWENMVGRSLAFWRHYAPLMREQFPGQMDGVTPEQVYAALNRVRPSFIRVEADECTYNLHIVLRFEVELDLVEGRLAVADVPEAWNAKVKQYLGLDVPDDARGCLQDIHWSHGAMGYFPTYALGNLYAAQMFECLLRDIPDLWDQVAHGRFEALLGWLREHVHHVGRRKLASEIVHGITGDPPGAEAYLRYLEEKYGTLYKL